MKAGLYFSAMKRLLTRDDFIETYAKLHQRGWRFIASKFSTDPLRRTGSAFNDTQIEAANWWIIPAIRRRWNLLATGDPDTCYEDYVVEKYLKGRENLQMLSLGCGIGSHERRFATHPVFGKIVAYDIADHLTTEANRLAKEAGLSNIEFRVADVNRMDFGKEDFDVVLFHSSLHHFKNLRELIGEKVKNTLKPGGLFVFVEYVGPDRLLWTSEQLKAVNFQLQKIPATYRRRLKTNLLKTQVTGPGLLRMWLADPSEAVESSQILPITHAHFEIVEEKALGGNLLMLLYKDIAHHFLTETPEISAILRQTFEAEDAFLKIHPSDMIFGVYRK